MRPVLMTSAAMIAGMIPMALALGEGAEATAPLGRAVIGGLAAATVATLIVLPSVYSLVQQSARVGSPSMDPDDPASAYRCAGSRMSMQPYLGRARATFAAVSLLALTACRGNAPAQTTEKAAPAAPPTIEVVKVVEQPLDVTLSLPGELNPYQTVALYSRVTGFVKAIRVDRGSRVRAGEQIAVLDAPELVAQKSEAQSKLQSAQAQLGAIRSKAEGNASTYEKLKAASATPGVVAGNDVVLAQKAVEADQGQIAAAQQNIEAARQALKSVSDMEAYLRITAPFSGIVTERNVHPGALVGPTGGPGTATPIVRIVESNRLRLVIPVPEAYTAGVTNGTVADVFGRGVPGPDVRRHGRADLPIG